MFSPVDANHLFVFSYKGETYDLNLETDRWINMKSKWGKYSRDLRTENLNHDPFDSKNIWIANFSQGLIAYNSSTKVFVEFPLIKPVSTIEFTTTDIWIGTWKGLYKYDRATSSIHPVDKVAEIYIRFVTPMPDGKININNEFLYDDKTNTLEKLQGQPGLYPVSVPYPEFQIRNIDNQEIVISKSDSTQLITFPYSVQDLVIYEPDAIWIPTGNSGDILLRVDRKNYIIDTFHVDWEFYTVHTSVDDQYFWIGNSIEAMAINKLNREVSIWQLPDQSKETIDYQDSKYFYSRGNSSIMIRPKTSILAEAIPLKRLIEEEEKYRKLLDSTHVSKDENIRSLYSNYKRIRNEFINSKNVRILKGIEEIRHSISSRVPGYWLPFDYSLIPFLDSIEEPDIRGAMALNLITTAAQKGMIETAVSIDTNYVKPITDSHEEYFQDRIRKIFEANRSLESLKSIPMNEDERLWKTANIFYNLFRYIGPETEASSIRMDYPFTYLHTLLTKYPTSPFADNAKYLMITHDEQGSHEGGNTGYNLEAIEQLKDFLKKYPDTELIPEVYLKFITLYFDYGVNYYEKEKYFLLARTYANKFYTAFPNHHLRREVEYYDEAITYELQFFGWELKITSVDSIYKLNSPILINYTLTNQSDKAKTISVYKQKDKYSSFYIKLSPGYDQETNKKIVEYIIHPEQMVDIKQDSVIKPGQEYSETKDITRWVDHESYGKQGYYRILSPGKYELWAFFRLESRSVPSNKIKIEIIK
ncbi:MAG TPA: hypothetical protein VFG10_14315 [Saprospiraceae bacterium]|nr:hypothetical protein [Saprospiraceae bacterium]